MSERETTPIMKRFGLAGKVAVITGGGRGLGYSLALGFAEAGADIIVADINIGSAEKAAGDIKALGRRSMAVKVDVGKNQEVRQMVEKTLEEFGKIDILVNNAGISPIYKGADKVTEEEWDAVLDVNLKGVFLCSAAAGRVMVNQKSGKIINISSSAAFLGYPNLAPYAASKAGVQQLTKVLAAEWTQYNVTVNAIAPGWMETELTRGLRESPRLLDALLKRIPLGRFARPDELVGAAIFLASDASNYISGQTLYVDAGLTSTSVLV